MNRSRILILLILSVLLPIVDNISGYFSIQISLYLRAILLLVVFISLKTENKYFGLQLSLIFAILFVPIFRFPTKENIIITIKIIFGIVMIEVLSAEKNIDRQDIGQVAVLASSLYLAFIIIANFTNFRSKNYGVGSRGFMISANDLGVVLMCLLPISIDHLMSRAGKKILKNGWCIFAIGGCLLMLTKASILAVIIALFVYYKYARFVERIIGIILVFTILLYAYRFINKNPGLFVAIFRDDLVGFLFRGRLDVLDKSFRVFFERSWLDRIFGLSPFIYMSIMSEKLSLPMLIGVEMDFVYLLFSYGYIGMIAVMVYYFAKTRQVLRKPFTPLVLVLIAIWIHAIFAGHTITSPIAGAYLWMPIAYLDKEVGI